MFRQSPGVLSRSFADRVLLASESNEEVDLLRGSAAAVWHLLADASSREEVVAGVSEIYGKARNGVAADVGRLVQELVRRGWAEKLR
jgi:hypothetical protein